MTVFHKAIFGVICGLMIACHSGGQAFGADHCVTQVLEKKTILFPVSDDPTFKIALEKGKDLIPISSPGEVLDGEGTLIKDVPYTFPPEKYKAIYTLKDELMVQTKDGQKYRLAGDTPFELVPLPPEFDYTAIIPAGTHVRKKDTGVDEYLSDDDVIVDVISPNHIQTAIQLFPKTRVDRIFDPGTSSMGATITVEPAKAPAGAYIKITVAKRDFDFVKARFDVCLRLHRTDGPEGAPYFASDNVELEKVTPDHAILRARIPENIDGLGGVHFAQPVDLVVVAVIPGARGERTEVVTQKFSVSSRSLASLVWILAFITPWFITACVASRMQRDPQVDKNSINAWKAKLNPIWIVSGKVGGASLSLAQILLWSILVFSASFYVLVVSGKLLDLSNDVLVLLGLAGGASVIAKITTSAKDGKGQMLSGAIEKEPKWLDLIKTDGRPDLYKFQMALFTTLAAVFVTKEIFSTMEFPILPAGLLTLIGISNGVYLTAKASSKSAFEELAEIDRERRKANDTLEKFKREAAEADKTLNRHKGIKETMESTLKAIEKQLGDAKRAEETHTIAEIIKKIEAQKELVAKAAEDHTRAADNKKQADAAVSSAQQILDTLQVGFEEKKKKALL